MGNPIIDVLLAVYNGEEHIRDFLDSLSLQRNVRIHLIVSDDGSSDKTMEIVQEYESRFEKTSLFLGPKKGPMQNFFFLLRDSDNDFVALADQDDIWREDHLEKSIARIIDLDVPALTYSAVEHFSKEKSERVLWPKNYSGPRFPNILFENTARGCTFVLNARARDLINIEEPKNAVMHDWWILLLIKLYGTVIYEPTPEIAYRLHQNNYVGIPKRRGVNFLKTLKSGVWPPLLQLDELVNLQIADSSLEMTYDLNKFLNYLRGGFMIRLQHIVFNRGVSYRIKVKDETKLLIGFLFINAIARHRKFEQE